MATGKKTSGCAPASQAARQARSAALLAEQQRRERRTRLHFRIGLGALVLAIAGGVAAG